MNLPPYSVVIPAYNAAAHLAEAVASVRAQAHAPAEIIVVDDGSTDDTVALARTLGPDVRCLSQPNQGPSVARNRGIEEATCEYLAFIDADDLWPEGKIARQLGHLAAHPADEMALGLQETFVVEQTPEGPRRHHRQAGFMYLVGCAVYRATAFKRIGPFDPGMRYSEDSDWFFRAWEQELPMHFSLETELYYRSHPGGMTFGRDIAAKGCLKALKRSLDRRRASGGGPARPFPWLMRQYTPEQLKEIFAAHFKRKAALSAS